MLFILQGTVLSELIVKFFHGDFTPQGFKRYSGLWKGPPPGNIGKKARFTRSQKTKTYPLFSALDARTLLWVWQSLRSRWPTPCDLPSRRRSCIGGTNVSKVFDRAGTVSDVGPGLILHSQSSEVHHQGRCGLRR